MRIFQRYAATFLLVRIFKKIDGSIGMIGRIMHFCSIISRLNILHQFFFSLRCLCIFKGRCAQWSSTHWSKGQWAWRDDFIRIYEFEFALWIITSNFLNIEKPKSAESAVLFLIFNIIWQHDVIFFFVKPIKAPESISLPLSNAVEFAEISFFFAEIR